MKRSLDAVQLRPKTPKKQLVRPAAAPTTPEPGQPRAVWIAVGITMAVIVLGWLFLYRLPHAGAPKTAESEGIFERIIGNIRSVFSDDTTTATPRQENVLGATASDEEIEQLQDHVFPEFRNVTE